MYRLAAIALIAILPLWVILAVRWPISSDWIFYAQILKSFSDEVWSGNLYPRWLTGVNDGFGSPVFLFYSPLPYYIGSLFQFLNPVDPNGSVRLVLCMGLALFTAGITSYHWLRRHLDAFHAEHGALLYAGFPYLLIPIYFFFGLAQLWAAALFPILLEAADRLAHGDFKRGFPRLAIGYAALCLTHVPSTLIFGVIPIFYVLCFSPRRMRLLSASAATAAALLGAAMAAIYLLPMVMNKPYIAVSGFLTGKFDYRTSFLDVHGIIASAIILLPLIGFWIELPKPKKQFLTPLVRFWLVILAGLWFMTLPLAKPLWDALPPLQFLQGTFRFFLVMVPATVFVAIFWIPSVKSNHLYVGLFIAGLSVAALFCANTFFFPTRNPAATLLDQRLIAVPEYQTTWMQAANIAPDKGLPKEYLELKPIQIKGGGTVELLEHSARTIRFKASMPASTGSIHIKRFYFPGWQTNIGELIPENGLMALYLPSGEHEVTLTLPAYAGEQDGLIISLIAFTLWLAMSCLIRLRGRNTLTAH